MNTSANAHESTDHMRFHRPHFHLASPFGNDWFARWAEGFARFFGTPFFLISQTMIVLIWIVANATGTVGFDVYPFILLNLAFSLQAAYAAPLILLAQTRQAERDKVHSEADAAHREQLATANLKQLELAAQTNAQIFDLLRQNTALTELTQQLSARIERLTVEVHQRVLGAGVHEKKTSDGV